MDMDYEALLDELEICLTYAIKHPVPQRSIDLSQGELGVLGCLAFERDGRTSGELRERCGVGSGRMADILNALQRKALVHRQPDARDNRRVIVSITPRGRELIADEHRKFREQQRALLAALGPADAQTFVRIMRRVAEINGTGEGDEKDEKDERDVGRPLL